MSDNAADDIFLIWFVFTFSNVAHLDAAPYSAHFFFIFFQESHVTLDRRIRESFVVEGTCAVLLVRINRDNTHSLPFLFNIHSNNHFTEFRIKSSMPRSPRWTPRSKTSSTRRHGGSILVSSSLPRRCVGVFAWGDSCSLTTMG